MLVSRTTASLDGLIMKSSLTWVAAMAPRAAVEVDAILLLLLVLLLGCYVKVRWQMSTL